MELIKLEGLLKEKQNVQIAIPKFFLDLMKKKGYNRTAYINILLEQAFAKDIYGEEK